MKWLLVAALVLSGCAAHPAHRSNPGAAYLAIANPANEKLDQAFDALAGPDKTDLGSAVGHLYVVAEIERAFDRNLLALDLPPAAAAIARRLVAVNTTREALTDRAAQSDSLTTLAGFDARLSHANAELKDQVRPLRQALGLPPPDAD